MKSPEQRGHYGALCLYQIIDPCKIRMKSRLVISLSNTSCSVDDCAKSENLYSPFEAVPGPGVTSLEQQSLDYTDSCVSHNRRPKCHRKLPLELHFLAAVSLKLIASRSKFDPRQT